MASGHDHPLFLLCREAQEFWVALDGQTKFLGAQELRVVLARVHAEDDHVQIGGDVGRVPAFLGREEPCLGQPSATGLEDLVVAPSHMVARMGQRQGKIVHGAPAHGNQVNSHVGKFTSFRSKTWQAPTHFLTFAT